MLNFFSLSLSAKPWICRTLPVQSEERMLSSDRSFLLIASEMLHRENRNTCTDKYTHSKLNTVQHKNTPKNKRTFVTQGGDTSSSKTSKIPC